MMNLLRWTSARTIKETFVPPTDYRYPFLGWGIKLVFLIS
jgi:1-pyrroline-5-carboxylate dehydrogenase